MSGGNIILTALFDIKEKYQFFVEAQRQKAAEESIEKGLAMAAINIMLMQHCSAEDAMTCISIEKDEQQKFREKHKLDSIEK